MFEYLKSLPLTDEQKKAVNDEGYENAPTFYMFCKVIPVAIREWLGLDSLDELESALWNMMSAEERQAVNDELSKLGK